MSQAQMDASQTASKTSISGISPQSLYDKCWALSQNLWWRYQFTGDVKFLKETAYPILKEASIFFKEYLCPDPNHPDWLISGPSNSPEIGGLVMGPTMDHGIIRNLFQNTAEAAEILGVDKDFSNELLDISLKIAPYQIGQHGQLQEWLEDTDDPKNQLFKEYVRIVDVLRPNIFIFEDLNLSNLFFHP